MRVILAATLVILRGPALMGAQPVSRPAAVSPPAGADPVAAVQPYFDALAMLGIRGSASAAEVMAVVEPASGILDAAQRDAETLVKDLPAAAGAARSREAATSARNRQALRERLCAIELLRGDLNCAAAAVLHAAGGDAATLLNAARQAYQRARVEYHELAISLMGHIGEAKALRIAGKLAESSAALADVLDPAAGGSNGVQMELGRLATMERIELLLMTDPQTAQKQASAWRDSRSVSQDAAWSARADWMVARALALQYLRLREGQISPEPAEMPLTSALAALRTPTVVGAAMRHERLSLLARLETAAGRNIMSRAELVDWADLLTSAGHPDAVKAYRRAAAMPGDPLAAETLLRFAALLFKASEHRQTDELCSDALKRGGLSDEQRMQARQLQAFARVGRFRAAASDADRRHLGEQSLRSLQAIVDGDAGEKVKRDALRQWADICARVSGVSACVKMLESHEDLVQSDAYLLYVLAAGRWDLLQRGSGGAPAEASTSAAVQKTVALLDEAVQLDSTSDPSDNGGRAILLKSRVLAEAPAPDKRAALRVLVDGWAMLTASPALVDEAVASRLQLLLDLGLADEASTLMESLPQGGTEQAASVSLALAERLARRHDRDAEVPAEDQRKAVQLAQQAVAGAIHDDRTYIDTAVRASRVMLEVKAGADARAVLESLLERADVKADPQQRLTCSLLLARAHLQQRQLNEAAALYDRLVNEFPENHEALVARGRMEIELGSPAKAVPWLRGARQGLKPGSEPWCATTLELVDALLAQGQNAAAADILRVAGALYPDFGSPELLRSFRLLRQRVSDAASPASAGGRQVR